MAARAMHGVNAGPMNELTSPHPGWRQRAQAWRALAIVVLALVTAGVGAVRAGQTLSRIPPWRVDPAQVQSPIPRAEGRFGPLRESFAPAATIGYISDPGLNEASAMGWYVTCQYTMAPVIVQRGADRRYVLANFWTDQRLREGIQGRPLRVVAHVSEGLAVLERTAPVASTPTSTSGRAPATQPAAAPAPAPGIVPPAQSEPSAPRETSP